MNVMAAIRLQDAATPDQLAELSALAHIIWHQHYVPIIGRAQVDYMLAHGYSDAVLARDRDAGVRFTLAYRGERSVGFSATVPPSDAEPARGWLDKLYVVQEVRNLGLGGRLIRRSARQVAQCGGSELALRVNRHNANSIAAYQAIGFTILGTNVKDIGGGFVMDDYLMTATIADLLRQPSDDATD